jgi:hypothetical protein
MIYPICRLVSYKDLTEREKLSFWRLSSREKIKYIRYNKKIYTLKEFSTDKNNKNLIYWIRYNDRF